jgi:hypothetical protein
MTLLSRRLLQAALLLTAAFTLTAGSCRAAYSLREAQDEYNAGVERLSKPIDGTNSRLAVDADPRMRFQSALDLIQEGELTSKDRPGHLRMSALTLQAYSHYALYRLTKGDPKTSDEHYGAALAALKLRPGYLDSVDDLKKPLVRREDGMLKMLHPLLRMEYVYQKFDERRTKVRGSPDAMAAAGEAYDVYLQILDEMLALRDGEGIPRTSPVAAEFVIIALDGVQAALEAYNDARSWGEQPPEEKAKRKAAIELKTMGRGLALLKWYTSETTPGLPTDTAALRVLAPKFEAKHMAVKARWLALKGRLEALWRPEYFGDIVWE